MRRIENQPIGYRNSEEPGDLPVEIGHGIYSDAHSANRVLILLAPRFREDEKYPGVSLTLSNSTFNSIEVLRTSVFELLSSS